MKSSRILLFCVLATASYVFHQHFSVASSIHFPPGRRHLRDLSMSISNQRSEYQKIKNVDEELKPSAAQEGNIQIEGRSRTENLEEIALQMDYHGVVTHPNPNPTPTPTPSPKHPHP